MTDMEGARVRLARPGDGLDRLFVLTISGSAVVTLAVLLTRFHGHEIMPAVDLVIDTIALVVTGTLTVLAWARSRERSEPVAVYQSAAFLALAIGYGIAVAISLGQSARGATIAEPVDVQELVFAVSGLVAAGMFVTAMTAGGSRLALTHPWSILLAAAVIVLGSLALGSLLDPPPDALRLSNFADESGLPTTTPFGALVEIATACLFFIGAFGSRAQWRRSRQVFDGWVAVGLLFAGFAALNLVFFPRAHPGQVSTADLFLLASSVVFLAGLVSAAIGVLREVRAANVELVRLRDAEVERAALEERARLARELHDGLAQDLWLAKLRTGELASRDDLPVEARRAAEEAVAAIDIGLGEAREAVATLRSADHAESGFCALVRRHVDDYGDRFGLRAEFAFDGDHTTRIAPRTQAEILRITQEALSNVARHSGASVVGVRLSIHDERIVLRIVDNGRGFDPGTERAGTFGLTSMRERAAIIQGRLRIASREGAGTGVVLVAPFAPAMEPARVEP